MKEVSQVSCVIPFYNEGERLFAVLDEMVKVRNLKEIICIDDGSDDDRSGEIKRRYPGIMLIRLARNTGKSDAIRAGVKHAHGEFVMLFDADLRNLNHEEIEEAIEGFQHAHQKIDMLILRRQNANWYAKINRGDVIFSGERMMRKSDLEQVLQGSVRRWQLESAVNAYMDTNTKKVFWLAHSGVNTDKYIKMGIIKGVWYALKTIADTISAVGVMRYVKQVLFFAKKNLLCDNSEM